MVYLPSIATQYSTEKSHQTLSKAMEFDLESIIRFFTDPAELHRRASLQQNYNPPSSTKKTTWLQACGKKHAIDTLAKMKEMKSKLKELIKLLPARKDLTQYQQTINEEIRILSTICAEWSIYLFYDDQEKQQQLNELLTSYRHYSEANSKKWVTGDKQRILNLMAELQAARRTFAALMIDQPNNRRIQDCHQRVMQSINQIAQIIAQWNTHLLYDGKATISPILEMDSSDYHPDFSDAPISKMRDDLRLFNPNNLSGMPTAENSSRDFVRQEIRFGFSQTIYYFYGLWSQKTYLVNLSKKETKRITETGFNDKDVTRLLSLMTNNPNNSLNPVLITYLRYICFSAGYLAFFPFMHLEKQGLMGKSTADSQFNFMSIAFQKFARIFVVKRINENEILLGYGPGNHFEVSLRVQNPLKKNLLGRDFSTFDQWNQYEKMDYLTNNVVISFHEMRIKIDTDDFATLLTQKEKQSSHASKEKVLDFWVTYAEYAFNKAIQLFKPHQPKTTENILLDQNDLTACLMHLEKHYLSMGNTPSQARKKIDLHSKEWFELFAKNPEHQFDLAKAVVTSSQIIYQKIKENQTVTASLDDYFHKLKEEKLTPEESERLVEQSKNYFTCFHLLSERNQYRCIRAIAELPINEEGKHQCIQNALENNTVKRPSLMQLCTWPQRAAHWRSLKRWVKSFFQYDSIYTASQLLELIKMLPVNTERSAQAIVSALKNRTNCQTFCDDPSSLIELFLHIKCDFSKHSQFFTFIEDPNHIFQTVLRNARQQNNLASHKLTLVMSDDLAEITQACKILHEEGYYQSIAFFTLLLSNATQVSRLLKIGLPETFIQMYTEHLFADESISTLFLEHASPEQIKQICSALIYGPHYLTSNSFFSVLLSQEVPCRDLLQNDRDLLKKMWHPDLDLSKQQKIFNCVSVIATAEQKEFLKDNIDNFHAKKQEANDRLRATNVVTHQYGQMFPPFSPPMTYDRKVSVKDLPAAPPFATPDHLVHI